MYSAILEADLATCWVDRPSVELFKSFSLNLMVLVILGNFLGVEVRGVGSFSLGAEWGHLAGVGVLLEERCHGQVLFGCLLLLLHVDFLSDLK